MKIGVMFGNPETTSVVTIQILFIVRMDIRRIGAIKDKDQVIGNTTSKIIKIRFHHHSKL